MTTTPGVPGQPEQPEQPDPLGFDAQQIVRDAVAHGEDPVPTLIGQLAGYASVCWESMAGTGVFQSDDAAAAVASTVEYLRSLEGGRTVLVGPGETLVLRLTTQEGAGLEELVRVIGDAVEREHRAVVVAPEVEAYVIAAGASVVAE